MEALFLRLVNMSITASWLVLAIIAVRLVFRKTPKWILCLLWGLVALRLICPFSIESPLSLIPNPEPLPQKIIYTAHPEIQSGVAVIDEAVNPALESSLTPVSPAVSANPTQIWSFLFTQIWIFGMVVLLLYALVSFLLLKRRVATAIPVRRGIKQSEFVDTPFVLGLVRPVIYLPSCMDTGDIPYVIAHERAHIHRKDHWWKPLGFLLLSVYWFNPAMWLAYILLCRDIEAACDEKVIRDMPMDGRRAYSKALLHCSIHRRRIAACPLAFGEVGVKARVKGIMNYKKPAFWVLLIAVIVSVVVAVCFLTNPENLVSDIHTQVYFDRTMAYIQLYYDEDFEYQISEEYALEIRKEGNWQELTKITTKQAANEVYMVTSNEANFDAWSVLKWEDVYGRLPDGIYRIKKDITKITNSDESEINPLYIEFTIGGTAEAYITYMLEDITPTGAKLYEHEKVDDSVALVYSDEGFWLEVLQDGQWVYMEPTEEIHTVLPQEKYYVHENHYPSSHIELDWSSLYGALPGGTYRIAREIAHTEESDLRLCTVYAEFSINSNVYTWFDRFSANTEERYPQDAVMDLPGMDGASVSYDAAEHEICLITADGTQPVISSHFTIRNVFLTDLTGDGVSEICATIRTKENMQVQVYDAAEKQLYTLPSPENGYYMLTQRADRLCVLRYNESGLAEGYGQLALSTGVLQVREIDPEVKVNLVMDNDDLPKDCFTASGHTFEVNEVIPYLCRQYPVSEACGY